MFTKEQIDEIYAKINALSRRDSDLPAARPLRGDEFVPLLQDAENRNASLVQIAEALSHIVEALTREELYRVYYRGNVVIVWTLRNAIAELGVQAVRVTERIQELRDAVGSLEGKLEHQSDVVGRLGLLDIALGLLKRRVGDLSDLVDRLLEHSPSPTSYTFAIEPVPSGATVVINGEGRTELTAEEGTAVEWSVSMEGYVTQSGSLTLTEDVTLPVELERIRVTLTVNAEPADAMIYIDGVERSTLTVDYGTTVGWAVGAEGYVTQSGSINLTEDRTIYVTLVHEGVVYSDIEITEFSYGDIPASGGTATPTLKYRQTWGNGSETGGGVIEDGAEVYYEGVEDDGSHTEGSLETTVRGRTQVATSNVTVTLNGKSATAAAEVWQAENKVEEYYGLTWVTWSGERDVTYDAKSHQVILAGYDTLQWRRYTSGATDNFYVLPNGHVTYSDVEGCDWAVATSVGFDLEENGSTESRGPYDNMETYESEGETVSRVRHVYQEGAKIITVTPAHVNFDAEASYDAHFTLDGVSGELAVKKDGDWFDVQIDGDGGDVVAEGNVGNGVRTYDRDGTVTFSDGVGEDAVMAVSQSCSWMTAERTSVEVGHGGGTVPVSEFGLSHSGSLTLDASTLPDWCVLEDNVFTVAANGTTSNRTARLAAGNGVASLTLTIVQSGEESVSVRSLSSHALRLEFANGSGSTAFRTVDLESGASVNVTSSDGLDLSYDTVMTFFIDFGSSGSGSAGTLKITKDGYGVEFVSPSDLSSFQVLPAGSTAEFSFVSGSGIQIEDA